MKLIPILGWILLACSVVGNLSHTGVEGFITALEDPVMVALLIVLAGLLAWWVVSFIRLVKTGERLKRLRIRRAREEAVWIEEERRRRTQLRDAARAPRRQGIPPRR